MLPKGFHRIRHYGLLANGDRAANIARARELLAMPPKQPEAAKPAPVEHRYDTCHSRWRAAGRAHVRIRLLDLHPATPPM